MDLLERISIDAALHFGKPCGNGPGQWPQRAGLAMTTDPPLLSALWSAWGYLSKAALPKGGFRVSLNQSGEV
jgi:hypothetical protein